MFSIKDTVLIVIDVQGRLAGLMYEKEPLFKNIRHIIRGCRILGIPVICTEQVPEKIGKTIFEVSEFLQDNDPVKKISFSCCGNEEFNRRLKTSNRRQILIAGIEAHVCVYQTVMDLCKSGYEVQVISDCISARSKKSLDIGIERMKNAGASLTSVEMILCELLRTAEHKNFKEILDILKSS